MVAGARFNPLPGLEDQAGKPHLLQIRSGSTSNSLPAGSPFASWDPACDINDSLLAAFVQLLSLEDEVIMFFGDNLPILAFITLLLCFCCC